MRVSLVDSDAPDSTPITIEVSEETDVGTLKSLIEVELGVPFLRQKLILAGKSHANSEDFRTLGSYSISDDDIILVHDKRLSNNMPPAHSANQSSSNPDLFPGGASALSELLAANPQLLNALRGMLPPAMQGCTPPSPQAQLSEEELQRRLTQQEVDLNYAHAREFMPESFGEIIMLYVRAEVNSCPIKAFVDSGAQATLMSEDCAKRCNLEKIIDKRFSGVAKGVGSANIVGRVHLAQMKLENVFIPCSFTILEGMSMDVLFGLDLLRRHQCCIDLMGNCLRIGNMASCPFLSEAEIREEIQHQQERKRSSSPNRVHTQKSESPSNQGEMIIEEEKVRELQALGFSRERVREALRKCKGNVERAAATLFD